MPETYIATEIDCGLKSSFWMLALETFKDLTQDVCVRRLSAGSHRVGAPQGGWWSKLRRVLVSDESKEPRSRIASRGSVDTVSLDKRVSA